MIKHLPDCPVFTIEIEGIAHKRPTDMRSITVDFEESEVGVWLRDNNVGYDLAMSGMDFIGQVYILIFKKDDALRFKLTWC